MFIGALVRLLDLSKIMFYKHNNSHRQRNRSDCILRFLIKAPEFLYFEYPIWYSNLYVFLRLLTQKKQKQKFIYFGFPNSLNGFQGIERYCLTYRYYPLGIY